MTTYYVDPAAGGANDGSSWTDAWTSLQSGLDTATAGDIVYCRGTQTLAASLDVDTNSGTTGGYIKFIGCAAGGSVDGTRFVIDGDSAAANCLLATTTDYLWFENFELKNATDSGFDATSHADYYNWINCISHNNGVHGFDLTGTDLHRFIRCQAYSNTQDGWTIDDAGHWFVWCIAYANVDSGFMAPTGTSYPLFVGCIAHDNDDANEWGFYVNTNTFMMHCVSDENYGGIYVNVDRCLLLANRVTNCDNVGIDFGNELTTLGWNVIYGNNSPENDYDNPDSLGAVANALPHDGTADTNDIDDTDDGYVDQVNHDFAIASGKTYRRQAIDMNWP